MDAAHFVHGAFLGQVWSKERVFIPSPSGRRRFNVLGALNAITKEVVTVENDSYINSFSVCELLLKLKDRSLDTPITLVLDNARYQTCKLVQDAAKELEIELLFLPPYSPNLNLIERLWKFVKKKALNSRYYPTFKGFCQAITETINSSDRSVIQELESLLTLNFQSFSNINISAA